MSEGGWIKHDGGMCPVAPLEGVQVDYRGPSDPDKGVRILASLAARLDWSHDGGSDDIIAYRVLSQGDTSNG